MNIAESISSSHNSVLFDFDSLVDIRFGAIRYMRNLYKNCSQSYFISEYVDKIFLLKTPLSVLLEERVYNGADETFKKCFIKPYRDNAYDIEKEILKTELEKVLELSPLTSMVELIKKYQNYADGAIRSTIFCSNSIELNFCRSRKFDKYAEIITGKADSISRSSYARYMTSDFRRVYNFGQLEFKSIVVLNYAENFIDKFEYGSLNPLFVKDYSTCEISIFPAYINMPGPLG